MLKEYNDIIQDRTWTLAPESNSKNIVGRKWIFKLKLYLNESMKHYTTFLVVKGFNMEVVINYYDLYILVVNSTIIRVILTLAW